MTEFRRSLPTVLVLFVCGLCGTANSAEPGYHVIETLSPGGDGSWDYLAFDGAARRLYIARSNRVMVLDADKGSLIGEVPNTPGVHGVALVPRLGRGFSSNGGESTVTVFDLKTLRELGRIKVGKRPDAILYDPFSNQVFTFNAGGGNATAIDPETKKVVGSVKLGGKPEFAVSDEKGHIYVNLEDKSEILAIDASKLAVLHRWPLAPGEEPAGLAIDRSRQRLFATCHNQKMVVLSATSGRVLATAPIGKGTDACAFDPDTRLAFSSNGDGTLTVVHEDAAGAFVVAETVATRAGARTMALDPTTHKIFLCTAKAKAGQRRVYEPGSFVVLVVGK